MGRRSAALLAALLLASTAIWLWRDHAARAPAQTAGHASGAGPPSHEGSVSSPGLPPLPESLRDTEVGGELELDARGRFVPTRAALRLFDYFLSATGEEPLPLIRARILAEIQARLPAQAVPDAVALLDRYLAYRDVLRELQMQRLAEFSDLERRLQWMRELRREHFGAATAQALFAEEEETQRVLLERRRVASDPALTPQERAARLEALEQELPEPVRRARAEASAPLRALAEERALREAGASPAEIETWRVRELGPEAARRLATLDEERASWQARFAAYRAERQALYASGEATPQALEALRARHFEGPELSRVRALDSLEP